MSAASRAAAAVGGSELLLDAGSSAGGSVAAPSDDGRGTLVSTVEAFTRAPFFAAAGSNVGAEAAFSSASS